MRIPRSSKKFDRDVKVAQKRGWPMQKLTEVLNCLIYEKPLPRKYKDHPLKGVWVRYRDIHIEPDWVLIYRIEGNTLYLARTGRHVDVFSNY